MSRIRGCLTLLVLTAHLGVVCTLAFAAEHAEKTGFPTSKATIVTTTGRFDITVEVAATERQRAQGLQWRTSLAPDAGMLFDFQDVRPVVMWMKNTFIPLDMLFIAADGQVVQIVENTKPRSLAYIYAIRPVRAVLELNAGTAARLGIGSNARVIHAIFPASQ